MNRLCSFTQKDVYTHRWALGEPELKRGNTCSFIHWVQNFYALFCTCLLIWLGRMGLAMHSDGGCLHAMFHSKNPNSEQVYNAPHWLVSLASNWVLRESNQQCCSTSLLSSSPCLLLPSQALPLLLLQPPESVSQFIFSLVSATDSFCLQRFTLIATTSPQTLYLAGTVPLRLSILFRLHCHRLRTMDRMLAAALSPLLVCNFILAFHYPWQSGNQTMDRVFKALMRTRHLISPRQPIWLWITICLPSLPIRILLSHFIPLPTSFK